MKNVSLLNSSWLLVIPLLASCDVDYKKIEAKAALINKYENVSLKLAKENRELRAEVKRLEFEIQKLKEDKAFYEVKKLAQKSEGSRSIASVAPLAVEKDYVEFKTYKWSAEDMHKIADKEFKVKSFEKAAQYYSSILNYYPDYKLIDDEFYYKAGIAAFESGKHHDWTILHFEKLMSAYPTSKHYRSAKLWVALTHMKLGEKQKFFATVEEFRKKYRNTNEWKILSSYYEKIEEKTHE